MDALGTALGGLRTNQRQVDLAAYDLANENAPAPKQPPVPGDVGRPGGSDLAADTVSELTGSIAYAANARVVDVSAQLSRTLVDILA